MYDIKKHKKKGFNSITYTMYVLLYKKKLPEVGRNVNTSKTYVILFQRLMSSCPRLFSVTTL